MGALQLMTLSSILLDRIVSRDRWLMLRVNRWHAPMWMRLWMIYATRGGDGWLWYFLAGLVLLFGGPERWEAVAAQGISSGASVLIFVSVKKWTKRRRPYHIEPHIWANLLPPDKFSFPSGHSMTAAACATALSLYYPLLMPVLAFCALSIAASRVILGLHFLSDVIVGLAVGVGLGYATFHLLN